MHRIRSIQIFLPAVITCGSVLFVGCIGTPFHVAGDVADAGFSAVGSIVEVPFDVAEAVVDASVPDYHTCTERESLVIEGRVISLLDVQTRNGSISIEGTEADDISIRTLVRVRSRYYSRAEKFARKVETYAVQENGILRVYPEFPQPHPRVDVSVDYEIDVPSKMDLNLVTSDGPISIAHVVGTVKARTSDGRIKVRHAEGEFDLHTNDGRIELVSLSGRIRAGTDDGRITARVNHSDESILRTDDGSVEVAVLDDAGLIEVHTSDGSIDLTLPVGFAGELDARTASGSVQSAFPIRAVRASRNELAGSIGAGGTSRIDLKSSDGNIHLRQAQ